MIMICDGAMIDIMLAVVIVIDGPTIDRFRIVIVERSWTLIEVERSSFDPEVVDIVEEGIRHCAAGACGESSERGEERCR